CVARRPNDWQRKVSFEHGSNVTQPGSMSRAFFMRKFPEYDAQIPGRQLDTIPQPFSFAFVRILYIDIDSQRPDHLSCYGYHRKTSPNIDRIAADGVRFENLYVTDAPCL